MSQISKVPLAKDIEKEINESFWWLICKLKNEDEIKLFFEDLLTPTEKTMLTKRLAIALFLEKGCSYSQIRTLLRVSPPTINHIQLWLRRGGAGYRLGIEKLLKKEKISDFLEKIDQLLEKLPPLTSHDKKNLARWSGRSGVPDKIK